MIKTRFTWRGDTGKRLLLSAAGESVVRITEFFLRAVQKEIGVPNPGRRVKRKRKTSGGDKGSTYTVYPNSSKPGEPPRRRTGWLSSHIRREYAPDRLSSRVGLLPNAKYGLFLELARRYSRRRVWLLHTLNKYIPQLRALAGDVQEIT